MAAYNTTAGGGGNASAWLWEEAWSPAPGGGNATPPPLWELGAATAATASTAASTASTAAHAHRRALLLLVAPTAQAVRRELRWAFLLHAYGFGCLFFVLAFYAFFSILNLRSLISARPYMSSINGFLCLLGASRAGCLLIDPYNLKETMPRVLGLVLWDVGFPCITSAFCLIQLAFFQLTQLKMGPERLRRKSCLSLAVTAHFSCLVGADIAVGFHDQLQVARLGVQAALASWPLALGAASLLGATRLLTLLSRMPADADAGLHAHSNYKGVARLALLSPHGGLAAALAPSLLAAPSPTPPPAAPAGAALAAPGPQTVGGLPAVTVRPPTPTPPAPSTPPSPPPPTPPPTPSGAAASRRRSLSADRPCTQSAYVATPDCWTAPAAGGGRRGSSAHAHAQAPVGGARQAAHAQQRPPGFSPRPCSQRDHRGRRSFAASGATAASALHASNSCAGEGSEDEATAETSLLQHRRRDSQQQQQQRLQGGHHHQQHQQPLSRSPSAHSTASRRSKGRPAQPSCSSPDAVTLGSVLAHIAYRAPPPAVGLPGAGGGGGGAARGVARAAAAAGALLLLLAAAEAGRALGPYGAAAPRLAVPLVHGRGGREQQQSQQQQQQEQQRQAPRAWPWFCFQTACRALEFAIGCAMAAITRQPARREPLPPRAYYSLRLESLYI